MTLGPDSIGPMTVARGLPPVRAFADMQALPDAVVAIEAQHDDGRLSWNMHCHDRAQLMLAVSQTAAVDTAARRWTLAPGQAMWLPGGIEHGVSAFQPPHFRSLYFRPDVAAGLRRDPALVRVTPFLAELGRRLAGLYNGEGDPATYPHLVALVLAEILGGANPLPDLPSPQDRRLRQICRALQSHPGDRRTLAEWGAVVGASCRTLERLFRQETGMGFAEWRQTCRIGAALPMLQDRVPVQVVAWQVGYDSPSAFAAAFRKVTGTSPSGYRPDA
ncbi:helix-turn-helix transcriptional regulator [Gemmobacter sp.]|uniref:helix-turn-helix transcriptional regulator n=1 Tax=Gemmobacter sp. TaxID=1898957 RepID=UPI002AFF6049|nr:helix-turn-helix transcriptional regulator [Gemmobacter sp.]